MTMFNQNFASILQRDSKVFINEFAENVIYKSMDQFGNVTSIPMAVVIVREPPGPLQEQKSVQLLDLYVMVRNVDPPGGVTVVNPGRDTILMAIRFGGPDSERTVVLVDTKSDAGIWQLRVR